MSIDIRTMRAPVTRVDYPTDPTPAEFTIVGNPGKPAALTDANVYPIPLITADEAEIEEGKFSSLQEVEELWQLQFRTSNAASDCVMRIWVYNVWLEKWYPWADIEVKGESLLDSSHGGVFTDNGSLGCSHVGVQVIGHGAADEIYLAHTWR